MPPTSLHVHGVRPTKSDPLVFQSVVCLDQSSRHDDHVQLCTVLFGVDGSVSSVAVALALRRQIKTALDVLLLAFQCDFVQFASRVVWLDLFWS